MKVSKQSVARARPVLSARKGARRRLLTKGSHVGGTFAEQCLARGSDVVVGHNPEVWSVVQPFLIAVRVGLHGVLGSSVLDKWVVTVAGKLRVVVLTRGLADGVRVAKLLALGLRRASLGLAPRLGSYSLPPFPGKGMDLRHRYMQLSRFSRALPSPDKAYCALALVEHRARLSSVSSVSPEVLRGLAAHCKEIGRKAWESGYSASYASPSFSSCYEKPAVQEGTAAFVTEITDGFRGREVTVEEARDIARSFPDGLFGEYRAFCDDNPGNTAVVKGRIDERLFLHHPSYEILPEDFELLRERLFAVAACWRFVHWDQLPICRRVVVEERGWKCRVVTPEQGAFGHLCTVGNSVIMSVLRQHPAIRGSLSGNPADGINWGTGKRHLKVRSLDLKEASDWMPFPVAEAAICGLLDGMRAPLWMYKLCLRAVGSHVICDKGAGGSWVTLRGALMGNPLTWPILNLVLDYCHAESGSDGFWAINGDDYIGGHSLATNIKLTRAVLSTGLRLSETKDFFTTNGCGVFSEELITVGRCRVYSTVSVKPLCGVQSRAGKPLWAEGPSIGLSVGRLPEDWRPAALGVVRDVYKTEIAKLRGVGIDPFAPRWCGGGGFPGTANPTSLMVARGIASQTAKMAAEFTYDLVRPWATALGMMGDSVARELLLPLVSEYAIHRTPEGGGKPMDALLSELLGELLPSFTIAGQVRGVRDLKLTDVGRRVREARGLVLRTAFWVPRQDARDWGNLEKMVAQLQPHFKFSAPFARCDLHLGYGAGVDRYRDNDSLYG